MIDKKPKLVNEIPKAKVTKEPSINNNEEQNKQNNNKETSKNTPVKMQATSNNGESNKKKKKDKKKSKVPEIVVTDENLNTTVTENVERKVEKKVKIKIDKTPKPEQLKPVIDNDVPNSKEVKSEENTKSKESTID